MRYKISYDGKTVTRNADTAQAAIEKLCDQYGWGYKLKQYDADTRGHEWAECAADTNGGINYNRTIYAEKAENEEG